MTNSMGTKNKNIEENIEDLNKRVAFLQDVILNMKVQVDLISRSIAEEDYISELTKLADDNMELFLNERPPDCLLLDECTTFMERGTLKILRNFMENGPNSAINLINNYKEFIKTSPEVKKCPNGACMQNAGKVIFMLENLIKSAKDKEKIKAKDLYSKRQELSLLESSEVESNLLTPITNQTRIKILKILNKGSKYYNQLEGEVGIKGGPFYFHLKKLKDARYIEQEGDKGPYSITYSGLKILKFLYDLREELSLIV